MLSLLPLVEQPLLHSDAREKVERGKRFIEQQQFRSRSAAYARMPHADACRRKAPRALVAPASQTDVLSVSAARLSISAREMPPRISIGRRRFSFTVRHGNSGRAAAYSRSSRAVRQCSCRLPGISPLRARQNWVRRKIVELPLQPDGPMTDTNSPFSRWKDRPSMMLKSSTSY